MARPVTLFTGQWADLPLEQMARKTKEFGYDGIELACWGDQVEIDRAQTDDCCRRNRDLLSGQICDSRTERSARSRARHPDFMEGIATDSSGSRFWKCLKEYSQLSASFAKSPDIKRNHKSRDRHKATLRFNRWAVRNLQTIDGFGNGAGNGRGVTLGNGYSPGGEGEERRLTVAHLLIVALILLGLLVLGVVTTDGYSGGRFLSVDGAAGGLLAFLCKWAKGNPWKFLRLASLNALGGALVGHHVSAIVHVWQPAAVAFLVGLAWHSIFLYAQERCKRFVTAYS